MAQGPLLRSCRRAQARSQATATAWEAVGSTTSCIADTSSACRCTLTRRSGLHSKQRLGARLEQRYAAAAGGMGRRPVRWLLVLCCFQPALRKQGRGISAQQHRARACCRRPPSGLTCGLLPGLYSCRQPEPVPWPQLRHTCNQAAPGAGKLNVACWDHGWANHSCTAAQHAKQLS